MYRQGARVCAFDRRRADRSWRHECRYEPSGTSSGRIGHLPRDTYAAYAAVLDIPLTEVKVDVKGYLNLQGLFGMDPSIRPGYQKIVWETRISSPADEDSLRSLVTTVEKTCPLLDVIRRPIEASGKVFINGNAVA